MEEEKFECGAGHKMISKGDFIGGVCVVCDLDGFWIDLAGGLHFDDPNSDEFEDPAKMYE